MCSPKKFFVYIMTNGPKSAVLYIGITKTVPGFTHRYNLTRLVYYECFCYPGATIAREKEIKGWRRSKKIALIASMNPRWEELARDWQNIYKPDASDGRETPPPAGENAGVRDDAANA